MPSDQSTKLFKNNFKCWKIFGIWGGRQTTKFYKYYSAVYLFITFVCYNVLLTLNLIYTPRKIELLIREVIFYFTEITVAVKVFTILLMHDKITIALDLIDCDAFVGDYENKNGVLQRVQAKYKFFWNLYAGLSNIAYSSQIFVPIFVHLIRETELELPICKYYFLSDKDLQSYYIYLFIYQSFGMYGHMMYNVNIDTFTAGLLVIAISQLNLLNNKISRLRLTEQEQKLSKYQQDEIMLVKLNSCLRHYDTILKYCKVLQEVLSTLIFFQYSLASIIICVVMCGLLLPSTTELKVFLVMYLAVMTLQIFVPGLLGTYISHESQDLVFAAYDNEWYIRSEPFKRSLKIFMERTKVPIKITGLKMFTLSLVTFTSIMKSAYSFFTLIRNFQEK